MKRLRKAMMAVNAIILIVTIAFHLTGRNLANRLFDGEWGTGLSPELVTTYGLLFLIIPALNLLALATNKAKLVSHKIVTLPPKGGI